MAKFGVTNVAGGGGIGSDELSVTKEYVLIGKKYVGADTDDEIGIGIMVDNRTTANQNLNAGGSFLVKNGYHAQPFTVIANSLASQTPATATDNRVMSGDTYWRNGVKGTGTMTVQSILSFSSAPSSETQIICTWKNPSVGPFSGVIIVGKTGGYPTSITDGTRYYKGFGNNSSANGTSSTIISGFTTGITYYFRAFSYVTINNTEWVSSTTYSSNTIIQTLTKIFTTSQNWVAPANVTKIEVFCVGGGAAGGRGGNTGGNGGGGGYTSTFKNVSVTPGKSYSVIIGSGGTDFGNGGDTKFGDLLPVSGGKQEYGGSGGGYGGLGYIDASDSRATGGNGGTNGGRGSHAWWGTEDPMNGQGYTTTAFQENTGTVYSGGGGGATGIRSSSRYHDPGAGGAVGGGYGGRDTYITGGGLNIKTAGDASPNTGGGGGGAAGNRYSDGNDNTTQSSGNGGSGICIIRYVG